MNSKLILLPALAALATPGLSYAQASEQSQTITVNGTVAPACTLGAPATATLDLGALTGTDGKLKAALTGTAIAAQTTIANAWCNTPSIITLTSSPLTTPNPGYARPADFAREIAFTANLTGWSGAVTNTAMAANTSVPVTSNSAHAADPLGVTFSALTPVVSGGAQPNNFIEAGAYSATVSITLAVKP